MMNLRKLIFVFVITITGVSVNSNAQGIDPNDTVKILLDQKVTMRDGVSLSANVWIPANQTEPLPVVFNMTPYIASAAHSWGVYYAEAGYIYVSVDRRGRGSSEGVFRPLEDSGEDGYDVIEWLIKQSWSDGQIAMRGGSYTGMVQWKVMAEHHPNLRAAMPSASVYPGYDFPLHRNIFLSYTSRWLAYTNGKNSNRKFFSDRDYWRSIKRKIYGENLPFKRISDLSQTNSKTFKKWLKHPTEDAYWKSLTPSEEDYSKIDIPILTISGYFDDDQYGALRYYDEHLSNASTKGLNNHYLLIGPWDHQGTSRPKVEYHGLTFDAKSKIDISKLQVDWLNWVLKGEERPSLIKDKVNYYIMGQEEWMHVESLASISSEVKTLYLSSPNSEANDVFHSGRLGEKKSIEKDTDSYIYDPLDNYDLKVPESAFDYGGMWSQKSAFTNNALIYHSGPLGEEVTLAGRVSFTASISMDVPDTDMQVYLFAIMPDGQALRIGTDVMRARYRNGLTKEELVPIGKAQKYVFDTFRLTAHKLPKGARLRLILTALDDYNYEKNYNSAKPNSEQSGKDATTARIKLHLGKGRTFLTLPIDARKHEPSNNN